MSSLGNRLILRQREWKLICVGEAELVDRVEGDRESKRQTTDPNAAWYDQIALYNLEKDVAETTNVARQTPALVAKMATLAIAALVDGRTTVGPARPSSSKEPQLDLLKKLAALIEEHK